MAKYRKKPVVIEAVQWTGENAPEIAAFFGQDGHFGLHPDNTWSIITLERTMTACPGDWIIRGIEREFYPCKPDIFAETYEAVADV
jgi:hypothetical protein